jgi:hypothetical protein
MDKETWRKSTRSGNGGECVEVSDARNGVMIRDTKDRQGATLTASRDDWRRFTNAVKAR